MPLRQNVSLTGLLFALSIVCLLMPGCHPPLPPAIPSPPVMKFAAAEAPLPPDDGDQESLQQALAASIGYWQHQDPDRSVTACGQGYRPGDFVLSLQKLQELLAQTPADQLMAAAADAFDFCQIKPAQGQDDLLVTGYYQPRFKASRHRTPPFIYPLYRPPADLIQAQLFANAVTQTVGRLEQGRLLPYWTRAEIEVNDRLAGDELCYLADPVDVFILQVQGSGLVEFENGEVLQLLFAGTNGREYRSIGRLLADEGRLPLSEITMPRLRQYLHEHLDESQRILHYNERYVFFRLAAKEHDRGPVGSMGATLTPGRSVALDQECFPLGGLYFLETERPAAEGELPAAWQPLTRFVLHQDTGAAIKGSGRLDFFWGSGQYAEHAAGLMKQPGRLYMLMKKGLVP